MTAMKPQTVTQQVSIPFVPRKWQLSAATMLTPNSRICFNVHRGGGKTWFALAGLCFAALQTRSASGAPCKFAYIGKSISHAKQVVWENLKFFLGDLEKAGQVTFNGNDLTIKFTSNNNMIHLTGIEDPEKIRGLHVHGVILDEAQMCDVEVWEKIIAPTMRQNRAWAIVIGTPNGPTGIFYQLWNAGNDPDNRFWKTVTLTVEDTGDIHPEEWAEILSNTDENTIKQEYFCSFDAAVNNRVYHQFDVSKNVKSGEARMKDSGDDLFVGMDFNIAHLPMCIAQFGKDGKTIEVLAEKVFKNQTTQTAAQWLLTNFPNRRIVVCPDASGASATTAQVAGSNHELLRKAGLVVATPRKNPRVADRILAVNVAFKNAANESRLYINDTCKELIQTCSFQEINEFTGQPDKTGGLDHMGDALGYLVNMMAPIRARRMKSKTLVF